MFLMCGNFPGRWDDDLCKLYGVIETDEHLFLCPGFTYIVDQKME